MSADLADLVAWWLEARCGCGCGHVAYPPLRMLAAERGWRTSLGDLLPRLRCRRCRAAPERVDLIASPADGAVGTAGGAMKRLRLAGEEPPARRKLKASHRNWIGGAVDRTPRPIDRRLRGRPRTRRDISGSRARCFRAFRAADGRRAASWARKILSATVDLPPKPCKLCQYFGSEPLAGQNGNRAVHPSGRNCGRLLRIAEDRYPPSALSSKRLPSTYRPPAQ